MRSRRRSWFYLLTIVLVGAAAALAVFVFVQTFNNSPPWQRPSAATPTPSVTPERPAGQRARSPADALTRRPLDQADGLRRAGKLQEAQDGYLDVLLTQDPNNPEAMNGLVQVRRRAASNNAALLRRQGEAYEAAAKRGRDGGEHYTTEALWLLARASYLAIAQMEVEDQGRRSEVAQVPPPRSGPSPMISRGTSGPGDTRRSIAMSPTAPTVAASPVAPAAPAPQPETPTPAETVDPPLVVRIGPLGESDTAQGLADQLQRDGLTVRVASETSESPRRYLVGSEPTSAQTADARMRALALLGIKASIVELDGGLVRLLYGTFSQVDDANALARLIRARGYPALVIPEGGTVHFVVIGPYAKSKIDDLVGRLRTGVVPVQIAPAP